MENERGETRLERAGVKASSAASEREQRHKEEFRGMMSGIFVTDQARTREMEVSAG